MDAIEERGADEVGCFGEFVCISVEGTESPWLAMDSIVEDFTLFL